MLTIRLIMITCFVFLATACQEEPPQPTRILIEDPQSALLGILLKPEDFSTDWTWFSQDTFQASASADDSSGLAERASITLAGKIEKTADFVLFFQGVSRYQERLPAPLSLDPTPNPPLTIKPFSIHIGEYGQEMRTDCTVQEEDPLKTCKITVGYAQIALSISIILNPGDASNDFIERNIDSWLQIADQRITELDAKK